jgi:carbon storage regulator CsrA
MFFMLTLSRYPGQKIIIGLPDGRSITVCLVSLTNDKARLGFEAPADVTIDRKEIWESIQRHGRNKKTP